MNIWMLLLWRYICISIPYIHGFIFIYEYEYVDVFIVQGPLYFCKYMYDCLGFCFPSTFICVFVLCLISAILLGKVFYIVLSTNCDYWGHVNHMIR